MIMFTLTVVSKLLIVIELCINDPGMTLWKSLSKTLWEKEKMLETSICSFSLNVCYPSYDKFALLSANFFQCGLV